MKLLSHNDNKPKFEKTLIRVFTAYSKANEVQLISFKVISFMSTHFCWLINRSQELVDALKGYVEHDSIYIDFKVYPSVRCLPIPVQDGHSVANWKREMEKPNLSPCPTECTLL